MTHPDAHEATADSPDEFGSGLYDNAAQLDDALPDIDWTILPEGCFPVTFTAPSGQLAGIAAGDPTAPRVLLVPGVTGSKEDFILMFPLLVRAGYRVESYDLAGQYQSADAGPENLRPPRQSYDHDLFVDDMIAVLESGTTPAHVLGYSFAATVAQLALVARPDLFASIALLSAPPQSGQGFRGIKRIGKLSNLATGKVGAALMVWGVTRNLNGAPHGRTVLVHERFRFTRRASVTDIMGLMMHAPELRAPLASSSVPKLVAVGEHDLWPLDLHSAFARDIGATIAVYRTGHSPCETSPHQLVRDLLSLYEKSDYS
ncbi:alpha/beta fold hydrolase [Glaciihabitans sp. dw_435]|uniref:alpha/beta fold hydrolase n=1 Tax=Glaciihabitans sp. dw_435 TaxID=2720081 RepID=UPI001BD52183|nr:alpha/beta hydrolase [Glaciihabitans sp. dw_435]